MAATPVVCDQGQLFELLVSSVKDSGCPKSRTTEVAPEDLGGDGPALDRREGVRDEALAAQLLIHVAERGLVLVQRNEGDLGVDLHGLGQLLRAPWNTIGSAPLNVDLQEAEVSDLLDVAALQVLQVSGLFSGTSISATDRGHHGE
ncbi:hypothetical protein ACFYPZ_16810 [Streptomyces sp. NPDC005506]|uniref:hypothetical protein n=1 Tax=Streptomyces sp. NPDC005506 TaxID=3364718 RepID=UPI0036CBC711